MLMRPRIQCYGASSKNWDLAQSLKAQFIILRVTKTSERREIRRRCVQLRGVLERMSDTEQHVLVPVVGHCLQPNREAGCVVSGGNRHAGQPDQIRQEGVAVYQRRYELNGTRMGSATTNRIRRVVVATSDSPNGKTSAL